MDNPRKDHIDPKGPKERNCPKQLQTHNLPTDHVENINSINKGRDLLQAVDCSLRNRKDATKDPKAQQSYFTSAYPKREQAQMEKPSYGLDNKKAYDTQKMQSQIQTK